MTCSEFQARMEAHAAGTLDPAQRHEDELHLAQCPHCRERLAAELAFATAVQDLPRNVVPGRDLWPDIAARLTSDAAPAQLAGTPRRTFFGPFVPTAVAAAAVFALVAGWIWLRPAPDAGPGWTVTALAGQPRVGDAAIRGTQSWRVGQWLETDATARAQFSVGTIGEVQLEPNSRLRLLDAETTDHRIELAVGTMHALIWAPPRLFFVETPAATAIDLGCAYTLHVADDGIGHLDVTAGYVALENRERAALVPAGMSCKMYPHAGPGTPFAASAAPELRHALDRFDSGSGEPEVLRQVIAHSEQEDAITLWHLLARASPPLRAELFSALAAFAAPPPETTRAGIIEGDRAMLNLWAETLGLYPEFLDEAAR